MALQSSEWESSCGDASPSMTRCEMHHDSSWQSASRPLYSAIFMGNLPALNSCHMDIVTSKVLLELPSARPPTATIIGKRPTHPAGLLG